MAPGLLIAVGSGLFGMTVCGGSNWDLHSGYPVYLVGFSGPVERGYRFVGAGLVVPVLVGRRCGGPVVRVSWSISSIFADGGAFGRYT